MLSIFNLNGDAIKNLVPIALIALAGVAAYWLWSRAQANTAQANAANADSVYTAGNQEAQLANLALLSQLFGTTNTSATTSTTNTAQATVTPGQAPAQQAPTTSGSSTGNSYVTQGV